MANNDTLLDFFVNKKYMCGKFLGLSNPRCTGQLNFMIQLRYVFVNIRYIKSSFHIYSFFPNLKNVAQLSPENLGGSFEHLLRIIQ